MNSLEDLANVILFFVLRKCICAFQLSLMHTVYFQLSVSELTSFAFRVALFINSRYAVLKGHEVFAKFL